MSAGVTPQSVDFLRTASTAQIFQAAGVVAAVGLVVIDANPDKISPDKTSPDKTSPDKTGPDSAGRIVSLINPQAGRLLGIDPATVLGQAIGALPAGPRQSLEAILRVGASLEQQAAGEAVWREAVALPAGQRLEVSVRWHPDGAAVYSLRRMDGQSAAPNEAEDRLGMMATSLPGLVFQRIRRSDGQLEYPFFSDGVRDALGYAPSEMRVTPDGCLGCLHWADRDEYMARVQMSALDLEPYSETLRAVTRDGQVRWLSGSARPERMENGDILWDCVLIDVTDRMRAEQRLNMIMDHAADGILTFDDDGCIELVNAAVGRIFGYRPQELQGRSVFLLMPDREATRYREALATYLDSGDGWIVSSGAHELEARRQDGTLFPVELTVSEVTTEGHRTFVAVLRDITQRKQTEARLHASEHRLSTIAGNLKGLVFQASADPGAGLAFTYASDGCRDLLGVLPEDLVADPQVFLSLIGAVDQDRYRQALSQSADRLEPLELDLYLQSRSGIGYWVRLWATPRTDGNGAVVWDGVALDVTDRKRIEEELTFLAYYDPLTRLGNRALFHDHFTGARSHADQTRSMAAVVFLGLDRFAMINAACGHDIGDQVLREVAGRLAAVVGKGGSVYRAGGDQFVVLLSGLPDADALSLWLSVLPAAFALPVTVGGVDFDITLSLGASLYPRDGLDAEILIRNSEAALRRAKAVGAGAVQVYTESLGRSASRTMMMHQRIRRALDAGEFIAHFQPKVDVATGKMVGMEALARWNSPERGLVYPGDFIEIAEEYGLVDALCEQVMTDACRWLRRWQDRALPVVPVAVNISGRQFLNSRRLLDQVASSLKTWKLAPSLLDLELTETSAMTDPENAIQVVNHLKEMGVSCSIDDFGTGYSSLSVLKRFPIRQLKIDRSFISGVAQAPEDTAIVQAVIAMAGALGLGVIAEGVETKEQFDCLRQTGCDQVQGYLFSRPIPGESMEALLGQASPFAGLL